MTSKLEEYLIYFFFFFPAIDPNTHIIWLQNVEARLKALREIEAGLFL